ncbi:Hypothetical protein I596_1507 [Dokdonella koreensis DS-123]|uniref:Uncharacterized protein n=1 Tax=Dokdonella koreensis DS-123 TaxID=1300342 RepID=A0A160DUW8_9GAMM|nr:Hypothetical protein I596_1507 [Dokdonella koreensis DS-123]
MCSPGQGAPGCPSSMKPRCHACCMRVDRAGKRAHDRSSRRVKRTATEPLPG